MQISCHSSKPQTISTYETDVALSIGITNTHTHINEEASNVDDNFCSIHKLQCEDLKKLGLIISKKSILRNLHQKTIDFLEIFRNPRNKVMSRNQCGFLRNQGRFLRNQ